MKRRRNLTRPALTDTERASFLAGAEVGAQGQPAHPRRTVRFTVNIPAELAERARDAAFWDRDTLAGIVAAALEVEIAKREKRHGEPFATRQAELRPGRPVRRG